MESADEPPPSQPIQSAKHVYSPFKGEIWYFIEFWKDTSLVGQYLKNLINLTFFALSAYQKPRKTLRRRSRCWTISRFQTGIQYLWVHSISEIAYVYLLPLIRTIIMVIYMFHGILVHGLCRESRYQGLEIIFLYLLCHAMVGIDPAIQ
jgi:hypothetical protein